MTILSAADIAGDNTTHVLGAAGQRARRLFVTAHGSSNARLGDANVSSTRGVELPADVCVVVSASDADPTDSLDLSSVKAYVPTGTTLTYCWSI